MTKMNLLSKLMVKFAEVGEMIDTERKWSQIEVSKLEKIRF